MSPLPGFLAVLALAHVVLSRLAWLDIPLQTDTGIWAYFAGRMLQGAHLYRDLWESKPPGIFLTFAFVEWAFGSGGDRALLWLDALVTVAVCLVTYAVARRLTSRGPATVGVCLLSVVLCHRVLADWGNNLEKFVAFFEMTALWLILSGRTPRRWLWIGICCGLAAGFKQTGIVLFAILVVGGASGWRELRITERRGRVLGFLIAGAAIPWILVSLWLWGNGAITDFWRQVVVHDLGRATTDKSERMEPLTWAHWTHVGQHLALTLIITGPALAACLAHGTPLRKHGGAEKKSQRENVGPGFGLVAVYAILATLVFVLAPNGYGHYLLQAAPPVAVLASWVMSAQWTPRDRPFAAAIFFLGIVIGFWQLRDHAAFVFDPNYGPRRAYASIRDRKQALTKVVRQQGPDQSVMLWPADHAVNYYAQRRTPLEICQAIDIFGGRIRLLDPPLEDVLMRLQSMPPDAIVDWTPIHVGHANPDDPKSPLTIMVPADGFSLAEEPNPQHERLEGRLLSPVKEWIRREYGGQVRYGELCTVYTRGIARREWWNYLRRDQTKPLD